MKNFYRGMMAVIAVITFAAQPVFAATTEYTLVIERQPVTIIGKPINKLTLNGSIPGPTLRFSEGDEAIIHVVNKLDEVSSLHWHGLLLADGMDGVPGLGGFHGIPAGETFTYRFTVRQSGTYWYHSHSKGQEQDGLYGAMIITPKFEDPIRAERDYVLVLSDFHETESGRIMANLKMSAEYYQYNRRTVADFLADVRSQGFRFAWDTLSMWGKMRMLPTDLSDVSGYTFLLNGRTPEQNWTGLFNSGERIRLRLINASAMSFYDVRIPSLPMTVVAADGRNVEPLQIDELRIGVAETYDLIVTPEQDLAYTFIAESIDRSGFALGTLAPREGMQGPAPEHRPRALLTMADMGGAHADHNTPQANAEVGGHIQHGINHSTAGHDMSDNSADYETGKPGSGWAKTFAPEGTRTLSYKDLRYLNAQPDTRPPQREIEVRLGGNMERYIWTMNGRKYSDSPDPIRLNYGERVRLRFVNETMMAHPMHLHGMFVQLENGQPAAKLPNKHTVIIAPGDSYSVLLTADEPGEWAFHCHMIFHMMAGMVSEVVVARLDATDIPVPQRPSATGMEPADEGAHHAH